MLFSDIAALAHGHLIGHLPLNHRLPLTCTSRACHGQQCGGAHQGTTGSSDRTAVRAARSAILAGDTQETSGTCHQLNLHILDNGSGFCEIQGASLFANTAEHYLSGTSSPAATGDNGAVRSALPVAVLSDESSGLTGSQGEHTKQQLCQASPSYSSAHHVDCIEPDTPVSRKISETDPLFCN